MARKINKAGMELVKKFEGFRADAYLCPAGVWTIGYGHTGGVKDGQKVTKAKAEQLLREDLSEAEKAVERYITVSLTDCQFSALVSFTFNLGAGSLKDSTLRRKLNAGNHDAVPSELARWVKADGKTLPGLVLRRAAEGELFLRDDDAKASEPFPPMPQRVESVDQGIRSEVARGYLNDDTVLQKGSVDDRGDEKYVRLSQNVPDEYVYSLQSDLLSLGFTEVGTPDGAFGKQTKKALMAFQILAGLVEVDEATMIAEEAGLVDRRTKDALIKWLEQGFSKTNPPGAVETDILVAPDGFKLIAPRVPHYSQGDPRWAQRVLGRGSSIRREGCAISCIAMILSFYGRNVTPETLDVYLDAHSGYSGNSVKWLVAGQCEGTVASVELTYGRTTGSKNKRIDLLSKRVDKNLPTIVRVDYGTDPNLTYNHFVVCVGKTADNEFVMNDPATFRGDGYENTIDDNIIQRTGRKNGYSIVQLDYYDPK